VYYFRNEIFSDLLVTRCHTDSGYTAPYTLAKNLFWTSCYSFFS